METSSRLDNLKEAIRPIREQLINHEIYGHIKTLDDIRIFMEHHIFAVWDFMSLVKALQRQLTCISLPWLPDGNRLNRRLINEIVLEEESDENGRGGYISHFEMYQEAIDQCGADTSKIDAFLDHLRKGNSVTESLETVDIPNAARVFVGVTWDFVNSDKTHIIASAFTFGREDLIPDMYKMLVSDLQKQFPGKLALLNNYLERHIEMDEDHHAPMARQMISQLCGNDDTKWSEAEHAATVALTSRITLWNDVVDQINLAREKTKTKSTDKKVNQ